MTKNITSAALNNLSSMEIIPCHSTSAQKEETAAETLEAKGKAIFRFTIPEQILVTLRWTKTYV